VEPPATGKRSAAMDLSGFWLLISRRFLAGYQGAQPIAWCYTEFMEHEKLRGILGAVAGEYGIRMALLFGSAVSGNTHDQSDIDIAILLKQPEMSFSTLAGLVHKLQQAAGDRNIDLALLNRADPLFLKKITENCILLYGSDSELHSLKILAFRRYQDFRSFLRLEREYVKRVLHQAGACRD